MVAAASHCERGGASYLARDHQALKMPMHIPPFRFPGVLNSQELLVAEAIQARAFASLSAKGDIPGGDREAARAKLGAIVLRLMLDRTRSIDDLAAAAIAAFKAE